jgi:hypothetical protein
MNNQKALALALAKAKFPVEELPAGSYTFEGTVALSGTVTVGESSMVTPTASLPIIPFFALALRRMGVQREAFLQVAEGAMRDLLNLPEERQKDLIKEMDLETYEKSFRKMLGALPKTPRKGAVKVTLQTCEIKD